MSNVLQLQLLAWRVQYWEKVATMAIFLKKVKKAARLLMLLKFYADKFEENLLKQVISKHINSLLMYESF